MPLNCRHVAEGAEARMRQLLRASEAHRPHAPLRRLVWDATGALRGIVPALQAAIGDGPRFRAGSLTHGDLIRPVEREGLQVPRWPTCVDASHLPREGARLVGRAERCLGGPVMLASLAARFATEEARARGHRGASLAAAGERGLESAATMRRFGMALADEAMRVPGAREVGLPEHFGFDFYPAMDSSDVETVFAREVAGAICVARKSCPCPKREAMLDAYRFIGHLEEINGLHVEGVVEAEAGDADYRAVDLARDCMAAAMAGEASLRVVRVPLDVIRFSAAPSPAREPLADPEPVAAPALAM